MNSKTGLNSKVRSPKNVESSGDPGIVNIDTNS